MIAAAIVAIVVGVLTAGFGVLAGADPEGRGGALLFLIPAGGALALAGIGYLGWRGVSALIGG